MITQVDVYRVGVLADLWRAWRVLTVPGATPAVVRNRRGKVRLAGSFVGHSWAYGRRQARAGNWRAVRQAFNGYLAEPDDFPPGDYRRQCGTGWTRRRAVRSLRRRLPAGTAGPWDG